MFDPFKLQEQLIRMPIQATAELAAIFREHSLDGCVVLVKEWQHAFSTWIAVTGSLLV
jgi:hypothetical protein